MGVLCVLACQAEPPGGNGSFIPPAPSDPRFGDVATCASPRGAPVGCGQPGEVCAANIVGETEPDSLQVDVSACTLDLAYTRGTVVTRRGRTDLVVHLGGAVSGLARVEASADGENYELVGFINEVPTIADARCLGRCASSRCQMGQTCADGQACWQGTMATGSSEGFCLSAACQPGGLALLDLFAGEQAGGCQTVYNVTHVRISQYLPAGGAVTVDAVEAMASSFELQRFR